jgi:hypothetical protein
LNRFGELMNRLSSSDAIDELEWKERKSLEVRESHFTYEGVMKQIEKFLLNPSGSLPGRSSKSSSYNTSKDTIRDGYSYTDKQQVESPSSDLTCTILPKTPRAADFPERDIPGGF